MTSQRFTGILFGLAVLLGLLSALDVVTPPIGERADLATAEAARSGAWTCPLPGLGSSGTAQLVASAPPGDTGIAAEVTFDRFVEGNVDRVGRSSPFAEQALGSELSPGVDAPAGDAGIAARWRRQPAAVSRVWERTADRGPGGILAAPCIPGSSAAWYLPGLSTAGGAEALVVLANPFAGDASLTLTLATPEGAVQPILLENVVVPGGSTRTLLLNEHAPEQRDVGVIVRTRSGRVVVEALQSVNAAIGGIEGVSPVAAAPAGADSWTMPWVASVPAELDDIAPVQLTPVAEGEGSARVTRTDGLTGTASSWLWVMNVGDDEAVLLLTVHGLEGGQLVETGEDPLLAPGAIRRISLDGLLPPGLPRAAITVATENGVPIVASVATQVADSDEDRTGLVVQLGASASDGVWVLPGEAPAGRRSLLALVNTGGEDAEVALSVWTSIGVERPEGVQAISVPAGTQRMVDVTDALDPTFTSQVVFVRAITGKVAASRVSFAVEDHLDLVAHLGIPSAVWSGGTLVPTARFDPSLTGEVVEDRPAD